MVPNNSVVMNNELVPSTLKKSAYPLSEELALCLLDIVDDDNNENHLQDWIKAVDRRGFYLFTTMELTLHRHLHNGTPPNFEVHPRTYAEMTMCYITQCSVS